MRLCMCAWITIWQTLVTWSLYIVIHIHICMCSCKNLCMCAVTDRCARVQTYAHAHMSKSACMHACIHCIGASDRYPSPTGILVWRRVRADNGGVWFARKTLFG